MKILFVSYHYWPPHFGGELKLSIERFEALSRRGHTVTVFTSGVPGLPGQEQNNGVSINRSPEIHDSRWGRGIRRLFFPMWVILQVRNLKLDILHFGSIGALDPISNCLGMLLIIMLAKIKNAKTVVVHSLADTEQEMFSNKGFKRRMRNIWLKKIDAIVAVSPALHSDVSKYHNERAHLIMNAVRDDIFTPLDKSGSGRKDFRQKYNIENDDIVFSFLGTISKRKGFDLIVQAFSNLSSKFPNWILWVIGPKSKSDSQNINQDEVDDLTNALSGISDRVKFWGKIDDRNKLRNILASSDIFLFPTRREGMPLAPIEAMACGVPPIIARIPGVTDLVNVEGVTGLYCKVGDLASLKDQMIALGTDQELRKEMGSAAYQRILTEFNWKKHISNWEDLYNQLIRIND